MWVMSLQNSIPEKEEALHSLSEIINKVELSSRIGFAPCHNVKQINQGNSEISCEPVAPTSFLMVSLLCLEYNTNDY
jgi:hypothetical protein